MSDFIKKIRTATGDKEIDYEALANRPKIPRKVSDLENDTGFITEEGVPKGDIPTKVSELENDSGFITDKSVPKKVSELQNDTGFVTGAAIPTSLPQRVTKKSITLEPSGWKVIPAIRNVTIPIRSGTVAYNCTAPSVYGSLPWTFRPNGGKWELTILYDGVEYKSTCWQLIYPFNGTGVYNARGEFRFEVPSYDKTAHPDYEERYPDPLNTFGLNATIYLYVNTAAYYKDTGFALHPASTVISETTGGEGVYWSVAVDKISNSELGDYTAEEQYKNLMFDDIHIVSLYQVTEYYSDDESVRVNTNGRKYTYEDSAITTNSEVSFVLDSASQRSYAASILKPTIEKSAGKLVFKTDTDPKNSLSATLVVRNTTEDLGVKIVEMGTTFYEYAKKGDVPTQTSQLTNTAGFITRDDLPSIPSSLPQKSKSLWVVLSASSWTFNSEYNVYEYEYDNEDIYTDCEIRFTVSGENAKKAAKAKLSTSIYKTTGSIYFEAAEQPTADIRGLLVISETSGSTDYAYVQGITDDKKEIPSKTSDLTNDSGFINTDSMTSYVNAKLAAYQSAPLKLTAPNGDVYVVSVSDSGQIVLTKQVSAANLITSPVTLTANAIGSIDYSLGLEVNKYYTVQIKFTNADGTETVKTGSVKAIDIQEEVEFPCVAIEVDTGIIDPNAYFIVYDKCAFTTVDGEPVPSSNENSAVIMLQAGDEYAYTSAVLESITETVFDSISLPLTITPSSMTWSNESETLSKVYSGTLFDTSKTYNVIGSIVIGGTTYELSVSNEAPIIYGLYNDEDPYIKISVGDDDNHRIYIRSANGYVTIELESYADESTTCTALTIDSITEGGSALAGEWATPVTFADASTRFSKDKKYTYSGTIGLENNKPYKLNVTVDGTTSDVIMWANTGWNDAGNQPKMSSGYNTTPKLPDFTDCRSHIGGEHYEADRCLIEFNKNVTPGYTSLTINSITEADTAPNGAWSLPMTVNMPESYVSECMFNFSGTFGLEKGKAYKITTTEGETQREYVGIAKAYSDYLPNVIVLDTTPPVRTATTRELKLYDNATLVGETSSSNVHEFTNRCAMSFDYDSSISSIVIDSITEIEIPVTGAWSVPQTYSSLTENATSGYTYSGLIGLAEYTSYKINVTIDGTTKDITSTYNDRNNGTVYCNFALDDGGSHYIQIRDKGVYLSYGDSYRVGPSDNNCSVIIHNGSYSSITINSITKVTA